MLGKELLQLHWPDPFGALCDLDVLGKQSQRGATAGNPAETGIVDSRHERAKLASRYAQGENAAGWLVSEATDLVQGHKRRLAVIEDEIVSGVCDAKRAAEIHDHADVIGRVGRECRVRALISG